MGYVSAFGVFIILYVVALIFVEYAEGEHVPGPVKTKPDSWLDILMVIPVICFGYQCHVSVIPIYSCMKNRDTKNFTVASFSAIAICVFTYTGAATFGYMTFGNLVYDDIISNYNANKPSVMLALVAISLKTYTTYPILMFCGREGLSTILKDIFSRDLLSIRYEGKGVGKTVYYRDCLVHRHNFDSDRNPKYWCCDQHPWIPRCDLHLRVSWSLSSPNLADV